MASPPSRIPIPPKFLNSNQDENIQGTLIYEVNLSVPKATTPSYLTFLLPFVKQQVHSIPGFLNAEVFSTSKPQGLHWLSEEGDAKNYFCVQYHIDNESSLNDYVNKHQERVATERLEEYKYIVISRRIMRKLG
ncbi:hypothetical protein BKA69DRAFT_1170088 [Paraphysoderma sedebokerense]|nr:hypothetical protein BKA69DRAFT_1170088 [Paraphysoderma sedebokerense]